MTNVHAIHVCCNQYGLFGIWNVVFDIWDVVFDVCNGFFSVEGIFSFGQICDSSTTRYKDVLQHNQNILKGDSRERVQVLPSLSTLHAAPNGFGGITN